MLGAISTSFDLGRVGIKLTPNNGFNGMGSADARETFLHVAARLSDLNVGYIHVTDGIGQHAPLTWCALAEAPRPPTACPALCSRPAL